MFVLDFMNDVDTIEAAFADYYRTTILSEETDPNKLHDLKADLDGRQVYTPEQRRRLRRALPRRRRPRPARPDPRRLRGRPTTSSLDEDGQVDFKGKAKAFARTYDFLASILPYTNAEWEKLSIFLNFLIPKLPAPQEEDLSQGILETIDMDSYRVEKQAAMKIAARRRGRRDRARSRRAGGGARPSPNSTGCPTSSRRSTTSSATSPGPTPTGSSASSPRRSRARSPPTRPTRTPEEQRQAERPRSSTTRPCGRVDDRAAQGRHRAVQAVQRQRGFRRWLSDAVFQATFGRSA